MVLFMLCRRVVSFITVLCTDVWNVGIYGSMVFSSALTNVEYEVLKSLFLFVFGMSIVLASFPICDMLLVLTIVLV